MESEKCSEKIYVIRRSLHKLPAYKKLTTDLSRWTQLSDRIGRFGYFSSHEWLEIGGLNRSFLNVEVPPFRAYHLWKTLKNEGSHDLDQWTLGGQLDKKKNFTFPGNMIGDLQQLGGLFLSMKDRPTGLATDQWWELNIEPRFETNFHQFSLKGKKTDPAMLVM